MTCKQTAHILELYDVWRAAEIEFLKTHDGGIEGIASDCAKDAQAAFEAFELELEVLRLTAENPAQRPFRAAGRTARRQEIRAIGDSSLS